MNTPLKHHLLSNDALQKLKESDINTVGKFLTTPPEALEKITSLSKEKITIIRFDLQTDHGDGVSITKETHMGQLLKTTTCHPTGLLGLDKLLQGGMKPGSIIEITGQPAGGKTQLVNTIVATFCENAEHTGFYIDSKMDFCAIRFERIVRLRHNDTDLPEVARIMLQVRVQRLFDFPVLIDCVNSLLDQPDDNLPKLLIIDSLFVLCRKYVGEYYKEGKEFMEKLTVALRKLAVTRNFIILFITIPKENGSVHGHAWHHLPSHKVFVDRLVNDPDLLCNSEVRNDNRRKLTLIDGPTELMASNQEYVFQVTDAGCVDVN